MMGLPPQPKGGYAPHLLNGAMTGPLVLAYRSSSSKNPSGDSGYIYAGGMGTAGKRDWHASIRSI